MSCSCCNCSPCTCASNPSYTPIPILPAPAAFVEQFSCGAGSSGSAGSSSSASSSSADLGLPTTAGFTAPAIGSNGTMQVTGAAGFLYANQLAYFPGLGCVTIISVTGDNVVFRNEDITAGTVIQNGTAFETSIPGGCFTVNITLAQISEALCNNDCPPSEYTLGGQVFCTDQGLVALTAEGPGIWTYGADGALKFVEVTDGQVIVYDSATGEFVAEDKVTRMAPFWIPGELIVDPVTSGTPPASGVAASTAANVTSLVPGNKYDPDSLSNTTSNEIKVTQNGIWRITVSADIHNDGSAGKVLTELMFNSTRVMQQVGFVAVSSADDGCHFEWVGEFRTTDTMWLRGSKSSGTARWWNQSCTAEFIREL